MYEVIGEAMDMHRRGNIDEQSECSAVKGTAQLDRGNIAGDLLRYPRPAVPGQFDLFSLFCQLQALTRLWYGAAASLALFNAVSAYRSAANVPTSVHISFAALAIMVPFTSSSHVRQFRAQILHKSDLRL